MSFGSGPRTASGHKRTLDPVGVDIRSCNRFTSLLSTSLGSAGQITVIQFIFHVGCHSRVLK
jgi:hypothetical protein